MSLLNLIRSETNYTRTENGDLAYKSTFNANLDLFGVGGALRYNQKDLVHIFDKAYLENRNTALKNMFYIRDIYDGLGERESFKTCFKRLCMLNPDVACELLPYVNEYGRYDDMFVSINTGVEKSMIELIKNQLNEDLIALQDNKGYSLLSKWMPSTNASSKKTKNLAKYFCKHLKMSEKDYRKLLVSLRTGKIIENNLRLKDYSFDYSKVPSVAMHKYRAAFKRNDHERYDSYINNVISGGKTINTKAIFPYQIIGEMHLEMSDVEKKSMQAKWDSIDRSVSKSNTIVVRDGSGSMLGLPLQIATSLAILFSEQLSGQFKNKFITFSSRPELVEMNFKTLFEKLEYVYTYDDCTNTDINKVYDLIYDVISKKSFNREDMIDRIVIISDMEFDCGVSCEPTYETFKNKFEKFGYKLPEIVYWNVCARSVHFATMSSQPNIKLVSGASHNIIKSIIDGSGLDAEGLMNKSLSKYSFIDEIFF